MSTASESRSLPSGGRTSAFPFSHNTPRSIRLLVVFAEHDGSTAPFSANPATCPLLLIALACPLSPPSVGRALMLPFCQKNGRHVSPVPKAQMSSPFGSLTLV